MFEHSTQGINQNSIKVPKVFKPTNKRMLLQTLGTSVLNSPLSSPSLHTYTLYIDMIRIEQSESKNTQTYKTKLFQSKTIVELSVCYLCWCL